MEEGIALTGGKSECNAVLMLRAIHPTAKKRQFFLGHQWRNHPIFVIRKSYEDALINSLLDNDCQSELLNNDVRAITEAHHTKITGKSISLTFTSNMRRKIATWRDFLVFKTSTFVL